MRRAICSWAVPPLGDVADLDGVAVVILAAGSSQRLGRPKQLMQLDGKPLVQHVVDAAAAAGVAEILVVLGHEGEAVGASLDMPAQGRVVANPSYASGQASSLRAGIRALDAATRRAVVLLGDQPRIDPQLIRAVAEHPGDICRASYRGVPGHPVAFDRSVWDALLTLDGDRGARDLIAAHPERVATVDVASDPPRDLDTEDDAKALGATG